MRRRGERRGAPGSESPRQRCPEGGPEFRGDLDCDLDAEAHHQLLELTRVLLLGVDAAPVVGQLQNRQLPLRVDADSAVGGVGTASQRADLHNSYMVANPPLIRFEQRRGRRSAAVGVVLPTGFVPNTFLFLPPAWGALRRAPPFSA